jgi:hypothetical protein
MHKTIEKLLLSIFILLSTLAKADTFSGSNSILFVSRFEIETNLNQNPELAEAVRKRLGVFYVAKVTKYDYASIRAGVSKSHTTKDGKFYVKLCDKAIIEVSYAPSLDILIGKTNTGIKFLLLNDGSPYQNVRRHCTYSTPGAGYIK